VSKPGGGHEFHPFPPMLLVKAPDGVDHPLSTGAQRLSRPSGEDSDRILGTIVYKADGRIVGYEGTPGQMQSRPHIIRPPIRSLLEMWWPVIASVSITILVAGILWRRTRHQRTGLWSALDPTTPV
jgi:hypothetical protein